MAAATTHAPSEALGAAESRWLELWTSGPGEGELPPLGPGDRAPDLALVDDRGRTRQLSDFWSEGPALVMFWRHFGCGCGISRARRLVEEVEGYREAGLTPVVVAQGDPGRAAAYRAEHGLPCPILSDPDLAAYRSYGLGQWAVERVLYDAPEALWSHEREIGRTFQDSRRAGGRSLVDDPWRATGELVVTSEGTVALGHYHQYCEDHPDPRVFTTAARRLVTGSHGS